MMKKRLLSLLLTLCMVMSLVPVTVLAAEGDIDITEVNINGVTGELWSHSDAPFASVDDGANYTVESQNWYSDIAGEIKPDSADRKPKAGEEYTFTITLKANDGYVFPIKSESRVFYDGSFKINGAEYDAGVITVSSDGKTLVATMFILTKAKGVVLQSASVTNEAELIWALTNPDVNVITMKNDIAVSATLIVDRAVTLDLYGYMLEISGSGSVIKVANGGHLTLVDSDPQALYMFNPDADGLWKWVASGGTKTVNGGVIYGGSAEDGGGVYVESGGRFTMNGGSIVGCQASRDSSGNGGGVFVTKGGAFEMNDGATIIGCVAVDGYGGGVHCEGGFTMNGGTIRDCTAFNAGAISYRGEAPLTLNGTVIAGSKDITGNPNPAITGTTIFTVSLPNSKVGDLILGDKADIQADMCISSGTVHANGGVVRGNVHSYRELTFSVDEGVTGSTIFYGQIRGWYITIDGPAVTYQVNGKDYAIQILRSGAAATKPDTPTKTGYEFDGWFTSDGTVYNYNTSVTGDITLTGYLCLPVTRSSELEAALADDMVDAIKLKDSTHLDIPIITRDVILDLNGCVLRLSSNIQVKSGGHLTLIDSNPTVEHRFTPVDGLWKLDETSGTESVNGGVIYGGLGKTILGNDGYGNVYGGGVYIEGGGEFTMTGGNIVGCRADGTLKINAFGGGVYVSENGTFTMTGGSIAGCTAAAYGEMSAYGGGIRNEGTTTLSGTAEIRDCHAKGVTGANELYGGGISDGKVLNISGDVKIIGCTAGGYGSDAMFVFDGVISGGTFYGSVINNGTISGLTVTYKNGDADYAMQVLQSGSAATRPIDPTGSSGATFLGWYNGEEKYDFTQPVTENLTLNAKWAEKHIHCICGGANDVGDHTTHSDITWTAWTSTDSLPTAAGNYYLVNNVTLTYDLATTFEWKVKENINLCLNGKTVSTNGTFASVEGPVTFSLTDCGEGGGKVFGGSDYFEIEFIGFRGRLNAMRCSGASTFNLFGGAIIMNEAAKAGDNKLLNLDSGWDHPTFNIYGGSLGDPSHIGTDDEGRYLSAASNTTFNAYGGAIYGPTYLGLRTKCNFGNTVFARDVRHQKYYSQDFLGTVPTNFIGDAQMVWEYRLYILVGDTRIHIDDRNKNDILGDGTGSLKYEFDEDSQKNSSGVYDDDFGHGTLTFNNATLVYDADADCDVINLGPFSLDIVLIGENAIMPDDGVGNNKTVIAGKRQMQIGGTGSLEIISKRDKCISIDYGVALGNSDLMILTSENADGAGAVLTDVSDGGALSAAKYVKITPPHTHCVCGGTTDVGDHTTHAEDTVWEPWTATDSLPTKAGNYYLTNNVTLKSSQFIRADVKLCLCGNTITFESGRLYAWAWSFTLSDCKGGGAIYGFDYSVVDVDGVFNMYGGSIVNNGTALENYCVSVGGDDRTFNLYGGAVGSDTNGFALIFMGNTDITAVFNAYGGTVEGIVYAPNLGRNINFYDTEFNSLIRIPKFAPYTGTPKFGSNGRFDYIYPIAFDNNGYYVLVTDSNKDDVFGDGTVKYEFIDDGVTRKGVLTLNNAHLKSDTGFSTIAPYGLYPEFKTYNCDLDIVLVGKNTVEESGGGYCIFLFEGYTLTFRGEGSLDVVGNGATALDGIVSAKNIIVESGDISISSENIGLSAFDFTVNGGNVSIEGKKAAASTKLYYTTSYGKITVNGGVLSLAVTDENGKVIDSGTENPNIEISGAMSMVTDATFAHTSPALTEVTDYTAIAGAKYLSIFGTHAHCICGDATGSTTFDGHETHLTDTLWTPWIATESLPTAPGYYFLVNDVTITDGNAVLPDGVILCLSGKSIRRSGGDTELTVNGTLSITDCTTTGSIGNIALAGGGLTMWGGRIAENTSLEIKPGTSFLMTGSSQNDHVIKIIGNARFTMDGNARNLGSIILYETEGNSNVIFRGHANGGSVSVDQPQENGGTRVEGNASIPNLYGYPGKEIVLTMTENAEIGKVENLSFKYPQLSGNAKLGSADSAFATRTGGYGAEITVKDSVQLFGTITVELDDGETFALGDKAGITGDLIVKKSNAMVQSAKVVMTGESAVHGKLTCTDDAVTFEMQDGALIDGDIDIGGSRVNGKVTCTGTIINGIFNGDVENNVKIIGGIFYGTVTGTGIIAESAKVSVIFDSNGGSAVAMQRILRGQKAVMPEAPAKTGYTFAKWHTGGAAYDFSLPVISDLTLVAQWNDTDDPTGEIVVGENRWNSFWNTITFNLFFKNTQSVTINAKDNSGDPVTIEYYLSGEEMTTEALDGVTFTLYNGPFDISPDDEYVIYVRLTDSSNNSCYISSNGIVLDSTAPIIEGVVNEKIYCGAQTVTIIEKYVDTVTVTVNGTRVELDANGRFVISPADVEQTIAVTDGAGNNAEMTVTVNSTHTPLADDGNCTTPVFCEFCNAEVVAAKQHDFTGEWNSDADSHWHECLNAGCLLTDTVTAHSGTATCTAKAVCDVCGTEYGDVDPANHIGTLDWNNTETTHEQKWSCCEVVVVAEENHEWDNGVCTECGHVCVHTGGTATCTAKAVCDICGTEYGEADPKNHEKLTHVPAKAATKDAEGNIEYWYCEGCGKYFADAAATKSIAKSDTVIAKLPEESTAASTEKPDSDKATQTGDESFIRWLIMLVLSGGAAICLKAKSKKKDADAE